MKVWAGTDIGLVRKVNQDNYYISEDDGLFIVADGMGGHKAGEVASRMAIDTIRSEFKKAQRPKQLQQLIRLMYDCIDKANETVYATAVKESDYSGMGTTLVVCCIFEDTAVIAHVGDSRGYIIRDGSIEQVTEDHSVVQQLINKGSITKEEARSHPQRNMITRAVGTDKTVCVDTCVLDIKKGDYILLCSDGLSGMIEDDEMLRILLRTESHQALIDKANDYGGRDNITVIILKV